MEKINVSVELKSIDQLTDKEFMSVMINMDRTKQDLITFIYHWGGQTVAELANLYINDQADVDTFVADFWQGDYDRITEDVEEYISYCYTA